MNILEYFMNRWVETVGESVILSLAIIAIAVAVLSVASLWKLFSKAGGHGWGAIVPFYNTYLMYKIVWGSGWWFLTLLIPFGGGIMYLVTYVKLAKCFGKGYGYGVAMLFFGVVLMPILAFSDTIYEGTRPGGKFISLGLSIAGMVLGIFTFTWVCFFIVKTFYNDFNSYYEYVLNEPDWEGHVDGELDPEWDEDEGESDIGGDYEIQYNEGGTGSAENPADFEYVSLSNGEVAVDVPVVRADTCYIEDSYVVWNEGSLSVSSMLEYYETYAPEESIDDCIEMMYEIYGDIDGYGNFKESELLVDSEVYMKFLSYSYEDYDGSEIPCYYIVRVDDVDGYNLITEITIDTLNTTESAVKNTLNAYAISLN